MLDSVAALPPFPQPLMEALGLAVAEDVHASMSLPAFDNSAMDGYAVRYADVAQASATEPVVLPVVGEIGAGRADVLALSPGAAVKIMTGAAVPAGADAVVPYEWTDRGVARVRIDQAPRPGQHIRRVGEDISVGDLLVADGSVLGARQIGLLASIGRATVLTRPRPRVVVISTGSELRDPGSPLGADSIYDGNSYLLAAAVRAAGAVAYRVGIVPDDPRTFSDALSDQLVRADLVVTSGGISEGDYDVVKEALAPLGTVWFGRLAMQPGKPQGFGTVGEDATPIFTLPGNPVSAYLSFELFVLPVLRKMMGIAPWSRSRFTARLTHDLTSPPDKQQFLRATHGVDAQGAWVSPMGGPGSHLIGSLAQADCLLVVPEAATRLQAGTVVEVIALDGEF